MKNKFSQNFKNTVGSVVLKEGSATGTLKRALSENTIKVLLSNYYYLEGIRLRIYSSPTYARAFPEREMNSIIKQLLRIADKGWLRKKDAHLISKILMEIVGIFICASPNYRQQLSHEIKKLSLKGKRTPDIPLDIFIFLLAQHINKARLVGKWKLIADFLAEQEITFLGEENIKLRHARNPSKKLSELYFNYQFIS